MLGASPWFVKRDLDGFFGLLIDNLVQLIVIAELTAVLCGFDRALIYGRILPAAAVSVIFGNVFYSFQARRLARREGRNDVTALPYGINTPSVFAFIFFIMMPVFAFHRAELGDEAAALLAWRMGLLAAIGSGIIEFFGAFIASRIRRITPRAALLSALAGIAITFISMDFVLQVFEHPLLALLPMGVILMQYFSGTRLPLGLPAGLVALLMGTSIAWLLRAFIDTPLFVRLPELMQSDLRLEISSLPDKQTIQDHLVPVISIPTLALSEIRDSVRGPDLRLAWSYLGVIIPMGLFNLIGSLQNIESAEAEGDRFPEKSSLTVNGAGTLLGAAFGSCFPTTIYIGHPGWKRLGARTGYSLLNGVVIAGMCLTGLIQSFSLIVPQESVIGILLWIAIVITGQAFQAVPKQHAYAVALGLIPAIAAWGLLVFKNGLQSAGMDPGLVGLSGVVPQAHVGGLYALSSGFILVSMGLAAMGVMMIEGRLRAAAGWAWALAVLSFFGVVHAWNPQDLNQEFYLGIGTGWRYALAYALWGVFLFNQHGKRSGVSAPVELEIEPAE
jgi:adenine/guanine/hypoxanthine permease